MKNWIKFNASILFFIMKVAIVSGSDGEFLTETEVFMRSYVKQDQLNDFKRALERAQIVQDFVPGGPGNCVRVGFIDELASDTSGKPLGIEYVDALLKKLQSAEAGLQRQGEGLELQPTRDLLLSAKRLEALFDAIANKNLAFIKETLSSDTGKSLFDLHQTKLKQKAVVAQASEIIAFLLEFNKHRSLNPVESETEARLFESAESFRRKIARGDQEGVLGMMQNRFFWSNKYIGDVMQELIRNKNTDMVNFILEHLNFENDKILELFEQAFLDIAKNNDKSHLDVIMHNRDFGLLSVNTVLKALKKAMQKNFFDIVKLLFKSQQIAQLDLRAKKELLMQAYASSNFEVLQLALDNLLMEFNLDTKESDLDLRAERERNFAATFNELFLYTAKNPNRLLVDCWKPEYFNKISSIDLNLAFEIDAATEEDTTLFYKFIAKSSRYNEITAATLNHAFLSAGKLGKPRYIQMITSDRRFNEITAENLNTVFLNFALLGLFDAIQTFLQSTRCQEISSSTMQQALLIAKSNQESAIVNSITTFMTTRMSS